MNGMSTVLINLDGRPQEDQCLEVPVRAFSQSSFRNWRASRRLPSGVRVSWITGNIHISGLSDEGITIPHKARTAKGYLDWVHSDAYPRRGRITLLGKEIHLDMSPEEIQTHNELKTETYRIVGSVNFKEKRGKLYSDGVALDIPEVVATEPDGMFVLWKTLKSGRVRLVPRKDRDREYIQLTGVPDWILEVVSRSSLRFDTEDLVEAYHRAGVSEYWLVNALGEEIDFRILLHAKKGYVPAPEKAGWQRSQIFERWFRFTRRVVDMDLWEYMLRTKK